MTDSQCKTKNKEKRPNEVPQPGATAWTTGKCESGHVWSVVLENYAIRSTTRHTHNNQVVNVTPMVENTENRQSLTVGGWTLTPHHSVDQTGNEFSNSRFCSEATFSFVSVRMTSRAMSNTWLQTGLNHTSRPAVLGCIRLRCTQHLFVHRGTLNTPGLNEKLALLSISGQLFTNYQEMLGLYFIWKDALSKFLFALHFPS